MMSARANHTDLNGQNRTSQLLQCTFSFLVDIGSLVRILCQHFCLQAQDCAFVYYYGSIASRYTIACLEQEFTPGVRLAQLVFLSLISHFVLFSRSRPLRFILRVLFDLPCFAILHGGNSNSIGRSQQTSENLKIYVYSLAA